MGRRRDGDVRERRVAALPLGLVRSLARRKLRDERLGGEARLGLRLHVEAHERKPAGPTWRRTSLSQRPVSRSGFCGRLAPRRPRQPEAAAQQR